MDEFDGTNITRALVIMIILTLAAISVFYIINNASTASQTYEPVVPEDAFMDISNIDPAPEIEMEGSIVSAQSAFNMAEWHYKNTLMDDGGRWVTDYWEVSKLDTPMLVRDVYGSPAYWKVPLRYKNRIIGSIDITGRGKVSKYGGYYNQDSDSLEDNDLVVPEMSPDYVRDMAKDFIAKYPDFAISEPVLVYYDIKGHDGWLLNVNNSEGAVVSRIFVTPYVFETVVMEFDNKTGSWQEVEQDDTKIGGIGVAFEEGITESETVSILGNYDLVNDYEFRYNVDYYANRYYVSVKRDDITLVKNELLQTNHFKHPAAQASDLFVKTKQNRSIIEISRIMREDNEILEILDTHGLQLKDFRWCYIDYEHNDWVNEKNATRIKNELEENEKILWVFLDYPE